MHSISFVNNFLINIFSGKWDDFKNAAKKGLGVKVAADDWDKLDKSVVFPTSTQSMPTEGRTIKNKKEWIKYYNAKIKEMDGHIKIIREDYAKQLKQATAAV
jgi:hypothetical protein